MIILGAAAVFAAAFFLFRSHTSDHESVKSLRMATIYTKSSLDLDPSQISSLEEYELLQNLYRTLVEYDLQHNLVPGVAKNFYWDGDHLVFEFDPARVVTVDGDSVTAEDAARSLKRAVFYGKTGHGDLRTFLCPDDKLTSLDSPCAGIRTKRGRLILTPVKSDYKSFLLKVLESADYSILPRRALSENPKDPRILNHFNTSGPYFVERDDPSGAWLLRLNSRHYLYHPDLPETIQLVPTRFENATDRLQAGDFDYLPTSAVSGAAELSPLLKAEQKFNFHESMAFRIRLICFHPRALKDFTREQRFFAAQLMSDFLNQRPLLRGSKPTVEFFQALSEGTLTEEQREMISQIRKIKTDQNFVRPLTVGAPEPLYSDLKKYFSPYPQISVQLLEDYAFGLPIEKRPDLYVMSNDSAWNESLSLLNHNFHTTVFHLPGLDPDRWMREYIQTEDKSLRLNKLKELHFQMLQAGVIYPVTFSPYYSFAKKPWVLAFSSFSSGTELWQIRKEP